MKTIPYFLIATLFMIGCDSKDTRSAVDNISGTYVREYSFSVRNSGTGVEIGVRTVRDTIVIAGEGNEFKVSNQKWMVNDYDKEGWRSMEHSDDRPIATFDAIYDDTQHALVKKSDDSPIIFIDVNKRLLSKDSSLKNYYQLKTN